MRRYPSLLFVFILLFTLAGCGLTNEFFSEKNCPEFETQYQASLKKQGSLYETIPTDGQYSMAMVLSQNAVNQFFREVAEFDTTVGIAGIASVKFDIPTILVGMSIEEMRRYPSASWLNQEPDEVRAQRFYAKVGFTATAPLLGNIGGDFLFSVPIVSQVIGVEKTEVWAKLSSAELVYTRAMKDGKVYTSNNTVISAINSARDIFFRKHFQDYKLFELKSWQLGNNNVKLIAGGTPKVDPVFHTLTFGMYTNLIQSREHSVTWSEDFPTGADIGLHIHPELIRKMIARMMVEGVVPDKVDLDEETQTSHQSQSLAEKTADTEHNPAPSSNTSKSDTTFGVTIQEMNADLYKQSDYFNLGFRLWKVAGGFCGYSDIIAGFAMSIDDNQFKFQIDPNTLKSVNSAGAGILASLTLNTLTQTEFFRQAVSVANTTINFNEIELTDSKNNRNGKPSMEAKTYQLKVDGNGVSVYLNLL